MVEGRDSIVRALSSEFQAVLDSGRIAPVLFAEIEGATDTLRLWSGIGPIAWDGRDWTGTGDLASIDRVEETTDVQAVGLKATLDGIPPEMVSWLLQEVQSGKPFTVWFGVLDAAGQPVADPDKAFAGRMDTAALEDGAATATISVTVESAMVRLEQPLERRWTHEDQQRRMPGDRGFEYVAALQSKEVKFGDD